MPEMNCDIVHDLIDAYIAGDTRENTARLIEAHMAECSSCEEMLEQRRQAARSLQKLRPQPQAVSQTHRRIVSRARRQVYIRLAFVLIALLSITTYSLHLLYAIAATPPMRVTDGEELASTIVPVWDLARELDTVIDLDLQVGDWLTINSILFSEQGTYLLFTSTSREYPVLQLAQRTNQGAHLHTALATTLGISAEGLHGVAHFGPLRQRTYGADEPDITFVATSSASLRLKRLLHVWHLAEADRQVDVAFNISPSSLQPAAQMVYNLNEEIELLGGRLVFQELRMDPDSSELTLLAELPPEYRFSGIELFLLPAGAERHAQGYYFPKDYAIFNTQGDATEITIGGPVIPDIPSSFTLVLERIHITESGYADMAIPWALYDGNQLELRDSERYALHMPKGLLELASINPAANEIVFELTLDERYLDDQQSGVGEWYLAPYAWPPTLMDGETRIISPGSTISQQPDTPRIITYTIHLSPDQLAGRSHFTLRLEKSGGAVAIGTRHIIHPSQPIKRANTEAKIRR